MYKLNLRLDSLHKLQSYGAKSRRKYVVSDVCQQSNLKSEGMSKQGKRIGRVVIGTGKCHTNWRGVLPGDNSKTKVFHRLAYKIPRITSVRTVLATMGGDVSSSEIVE